MAPRTFSAYDAQQLLARIQGLSFVDHRYFNQISNALATLALWAPDQHHHVTAEAWIRRLYAELSSGHLPLNHPLYAQGLRRLRTLCGRTDPLPPIFDFPQYIHRGFQASSPAAVNSEVYQAVSGHLVLAVKRIRADERERQDIRSTFRKEAVVWLLLRHPNVVPFYGVRRTKPYDPVDLVSKWMAHGELTSFLRRHPEHNPLRYLRDVISGLAFIHSLQMVHADLKGRNVLVDEHYHACIADFGHSVTMHRTGLPTTHLVDGGTIAFMAPELISHEGDGPPPRTAASDVYALAILIWEVFAGDDPHMGMKDSVIQLKVVMKGLRPKRDDAHHLRRSGFDALWAITERAWAQNPRDRCTLGDVARVLEGYPK